MFFRLNVTFEVKPILYQISVQNVKSLVLESSTFSHLPPGSVQVDRTGKVATNFVSLFFLDVHFPSLLSKF